MMTPSPNPSSKIERRTSPYDLASSDIAEGPPRDISVNRSFSSPLSADTNNATASRMSSSSKPQLQQQQHLKKNSSSSISETHDSGAFHIVDNELIEIPPQSSDAFDDDPFKSAHHRSRRRSAGSGRATAACIQMSKIDIGKSPVGKQVGKLFSYTKDKKKNIRKQASQLRDHSRQKKKNRNKGGVPATIDFTIKGSTKKIHRAMSSMSMSNVSNPFSSLSRLEDEFYGNQSDEEGSSERRYSCSSPIPNFHNVRNTAQRAASITTSQIVQVGKNISNSWHHDSKSGISSPPVTNNLQGSLRRVTTSLTGGENSLSKSTLSEFIDVHKDIAFAASDNTDMSDVISDDVSAISVNTSSFPSTPIHPDLSRESSMSPPPPQARNIDEDLRPVNVRSRISQFEGYAQLGKALANGFHGPVTPRRRGRQTNALPQIASPPPSMFSRSFDGQKGIRNLLRPHENIFSPSSKAEVHHDCNDRLKVLLLGSPRGGKSRIARGLCGVEKSTKSRNKVHVNIHDIEQTQATSGRMIKLSIWDIQGTAAERRSKSHHDDSSTRTNGILRAHFATRSLFFSSNSLYILVWDMAVNNPQANGEYDEFSSASSYSDESEYETDEDDDMKRIAKENAILRDIDEHIMFWIQAIAERKCCGCAVMPVVTFSDKLVDSEVNYRCDLLLRQLKLYKPKGPIFPQILLGTSKKIPVFSLDTSSGLDQLRLNLEEITKQDPIEGLNTFKSQFDSKLSPVTLSVRNVITAFAEDGYELLHFEQVYVKLAEDPPVAENFTQYLVREALTYLHSTGFILFYGDTSNPIIDDLSEYIILDPKWLSKAISQTLHEDWRRALTSSRHSSLNISEDERSIASSVRTKLDCPLMTSEQAILLWKGSSYVNTQYEKLPVEYAKPLCDFLQSLCIHIGIFLPVDVDVNKQDNFLIPCMAKDIKPDFWSYKTKDDWLTTLANAWHITKSPPCDFFDQISIVVFEELTKMSSQSEGSTKGGYIREPEIMYWNSAIYASIVEEMHVGDRLETTSAELFITLVNPDSPICIGSEDMYCNDLKLIIAAKGFLGKSGEKIWNLGYRIILDAIEALVDNLEVSEKRETYCPQCLLSSDPAKAYFWDADFLAAHRNESTIRCSHHSSVDTKLLLGPERDIGDDSTVGTGIATTYTSLTTGTIMTTGSFMTTGRDMPPNSTFEQLKSSVVVVGHWDAVKFKIINVGSGFICDTKLGLIVTSAHIFYDIQFNQPVTPKVEKEHKHDRNEQGRIQAVIGVITQNTTNTASFKYIAELITHCTSDVDACILRLTHKFEVPVDVVDGVQLPQQPEFPLGIINPIKDEKLSKLTLCRDVEVEENIRILGYDQCGEGGLHEMGSVVNQEQGLARGYVHSRLGKKLTVAASKKYFVPTEEIVVKCPANIGTSGGPCVNENGGVIGIMSRSDPVELDRCYLAPTSQIRKLIKSARRKCNGTVAVTWQ